ncbi:MAG: 16S rRNA (cytidine(1402)-2'-O)-methyltransferase [Pseudomonadota bacterium]
MTATFTIRDHAFTAPPLPAGLYPVATPIGNLGDITIRALEVLAAANVIACEDTRTSGVLLKRYGIDTRRVSYTEHNAVERGPELLRAIEDGQAVALISDAGTPLISDPGLRLVRDCAAQGLSVTPLPGASAPLAALVGSGLGEGEFRFIGFLPSKQQARRNRLAELANDPATLVLFESPNRIADTLEDAAVAFGADREASVARELTKLHETFHRGRLAELANSFAAMDRVRGEIVLVIAPAPPPQFDAADTETLLRNALAEMKTKDAAAHVAALTGEPKQALYARALALKNER